MSRDSLNGTITGTNLYQSNDNRYQQPLPTSESVNIEQLTSTEAEQYQPRIISPKVCVLFVRSNLYFSNRIFNNKKMIID